MLKSAGLAYRGMDKCHLHDLRRLRNELDRHIHGLSDKERSEKLGHSERVNKDHYNVEFDQTIVNLTTEIKSLKAKITMLEVELELEREPLMSPVWTKKKGLRRSPFVFWRRVRDSNSRPIGSKPTTLSS